MAATAEEEAIIRKRYLTQTVLSAANVQPPFKKLTARYLEFCASLQGGSADDAARIHPHLLADLYAIQAHMDKLRAMSDAYEREQAAYAERQAQLQAAIAQASKLPCTPPAWLCPPRRRGGRPQPWRATLGIARLVAEADIEERKRQLGEARVELAQQQEYEAVKKAVMQVPSRATTLAEQDGTQREIADLKQQSAALDALFRARKQQFAGVLASLEQLQRIIDREEPEESVVALPEGGAAAAAGSGGAAAATAAGLQQQQQDRAMQVG